MIKSIGQIEQQIWAAKRNHLKHASKMFAVEKLFCGLAFFLLKERNLVLLHAATDVATKEITLTQNKCLKVHII